MASRDMRYDVFISCKSEDYNIGRQVYEFLTNYRGINLNVFMADKELRKRGNTDYGKIIDQALDSSTHLIIVSSNAEYLQESSTYVYEEWHTFVEEIRSGRKEGNIMTIFTDDVELKDVPIALRNRQSFPFTEYSAIIDYLSNIDNTISATPTPINEEQDDDEPEIDLDYEDALDFIESGELQDAIHSLQISFKSGNSKTINLFNKLLFQNYGNIDWDEETWRFFEEQANAGWSFAHLAFFYKLLHNRETYSQAWKHLKSARLDHKNGYAILCEGIAYEKGIGISPNLKIATNRFKNALKMEIWESCSYLAEMYLCGNSSVKISKENAINILAEGQKHDDARSWYVLGSIYKENAHIKENWEKAVESFRKAVELHLYEAWIDLGKLYNYNRFSGDYKDEALSCYLEALKNGNKDAHAYIAMQYWDKDRQEDAIIEASKGQKAGNVMSISTLGKFYEEGLQKEGHWIRERKPDYPKAWDYYREAFQLGGHIEDAISMARLYVKDEYRPQDISWETIQRYLEEGAKVPIIEALELMIEVLKKNGKENEILKYLKIGAESGSLSMKHEYGIHLQSTDETFLRFIEEAGENKYLPSVEWLINYYKTPQTYSKNNYHKWLEIGADMNIEVSLDDYIPYLVENNPQKAQDFLLNKYKYSGKTEYLIWIYKYHKALNIDKQWLLSEFKSNYIGNQELYKPYVDFLLRNKYIDEYKEFCINISVKNQDERRYYSLLREVYNTKEFNKELAIKINALIKDESAPYDLRERSRSLLYDYLSNKTNSKVLVVDDVVSNVLLLKILLTNEGYNVCTANSGKMCIEQVQKERPDVILLDVMMPGISGFDVATILKQDPKTQNIPIMLTGSYDGSDLVHGFQVGAKDFLSKPFYKEELLSRTKSLVIESKLTKIMPEGVDIRGSKILIVDDVISNILLIKILFTNEGFQVITANNGVQCIEQTRKERPDLILLDVMMPGISGFDVATILKQDPKTQNIPIMFLTALNNPSDMAKGFQVGADDFMFKLFDKEELFIRIKRMLIINKSISKLLNS